MSTSRKPLEYAGACRGVLGLEFYLNLPNISLPQNVVPEYKARGAAPPPLGGHGQAVLILRMIYGLQAIRLGGAHLTTSSGVLYLCRYLFKSTENANTRKFRIQEQFGRNGFYPNL